MKYHMIDSRYYNHDCNIIATKGQRLKFDFQNGQRLKYICSTNYGNHHTLVIFICYKSIIPAQGSEELQWGPVDIICLSVRPSVSLSACLSVPLSLCPVIHVDFWQSFAWPIILHSACIRRPQVQIL